MLNDSLFKTLQAIVHPKFGIATHLTQFPLPASLPPYYQYSLPMADHRRVLAESRGISRQAYYGSGFDTREHNAIQSSIGETLERYTGSLYSESELIVGTGTELKTDLGPVLKLIGYDDRLKQVGSDRRFWKYSDDLRRRWLWGTELSTGNQRLLPAQCVIFDFPCWEGERIYTTTSNGLAAGPTVEFATTRALLELIERDAFMGHWLLRKSPIPFELDLCKYDTTLRPLMESELVTAKTFLLETDINIPVVLGVIEGKNSGLFSIGACARFDIREAARKALMEACHSWCFVSDCRARKIKYLVEDDVADFLDHAAYYLDPEHRHMAEFMVAPQASKRQNVSKRFGTVPRFASAKEELARIVELLSSQGFQSFAFDRTIVEVRDLGYHVVRTVVPGLQPLFAGQDWVPTNTSRLSSYEEPSYTLPADYQQLNFDIHPFP